MITYLKLECKIVYSFATSRASRFNAGICVGGLPPAPPPKKKLIDFTELFYSVDAFAFVCVRWGPDVFEKHRTETLVFTALLC